MTDNSEAEVLEYTVKVKYRLADGETVSPETFHGEIHQHIINSGGIFAYRMRPDGGKHYFSYYVVDEVVLV